ncbi:hypothetical protein LXL04_023673 [Taraxacum kok-saghyz]
MSFLFSLFDPLDHSEWVQRSDRGEDVDRRGGHTGWTEVRHRKRSTPGVRHPHANSYFVAGMADCTTKLEIQKCFNGYGDIADVYMGKKKDKSGNNFAFVKFNNVRDIWRLEEDMQNITCGGISL